MEGERHTSTYTQAHKHIRICVCVCARLKRVLFPWEHWLHILHINLPLLLFPLWHLSLVQLRTSSESRILGPELRRVRRSATKFARKKSSCYTPSLRLPAPVGFNKLQILTASRLISSWKENPQLCPLSYKGKKSNQAFSLNGIHWKLKKWFQPPLGFLYRLWSKERPTSSSPGTWWLRTGSRAGEKDTSNTAISISISK